MSLGMIALIGLIVLFILLLCNMPISFAMLIVGFVGILAVLGDRAAYSLLTSDLYGQLSAYSLSVIPMFVLMGEIIYRSGTANGLFNTAHKWLGGFRGGIAWTTILASAAFGSIAGSNAATTATIGTMALPEMKKYKYNQRFSAGIIAAGGTLGVIIPPSTVILVLAVQTGLSVTDLFIAIMIPSVLIVSLFLIVTTIVCYRRKDYAPVSDEKFTWKERFLSLVDIIPVLFLFLLSIGGLFLGWFTPTEAGAFGAFGAIVLALIMKTLTKEVLIASLLSTIKSSVMVILLIVSATVFGRFLAVTRVPFEVAEWASNLTIASVWVVVLILAIFIIGGALMDAIGFLVLAIPIFFPTIVALGYDPIWLATVLVIVTSLGAITPPVGINVFVTHGLDKSISSTEIFKGTFIFIGAYFVLLALLIAFPWLVTGLL